MSNNAYNTKEIMGLTNTHLVDVGSGHHLHHEVADAFYTMQKTAIAANIDLQICSSFRSFDKQLSIWNRKWKGELPLYSIQNTKLKAEELSDVDKIHAIMLWSALPGASRHHWGTDFDVYDKQSVLKHKHKFELVPSEYENDGPCAQLSTWLNSHAKSFGFYFPYAEYVGGVAKEPWHISNRTLSQRIEKHFRIDDLYAQLEQADILGKKVILELLPDLVKRYTFNKGVDLRNTNNGT